MRGIGARIKQLRLQKDMTQADLGKALNVHANTIGSWENETREIQLDSLDAICDYFNVKLQWLMAGDLDAVMGVSPEDSIYLPLISAKVGTGYGLENWDYEAIRKHPISRDLLPPGNRDKIRLLEVEGDSMYPTLSPGDLVAFTEGLIAGDGLYVLNRGGELFVKRLHFRMTDGSIAIISDNPRYKEEIIEEKEQQRHFHVVGKVVKLISGR
jgi:transcriptional regulator with XRE-family HTH domain